MTAVVVPAPEAEAGSPSRPRGSADLSAVLALGLGLAGAFVGHALVPSVGVLTWAVGLGVVAANTGLLPASSTACLGWTTRRLLRVGVVLLGFSISLASVVALGVPVVALTAGTLVATLLFTIWLARRMGVGHSRSLVLGAGFAICGASAIAAMERTADADDEDVTAAIAMVTLWGTVAMIALPALQAPLGLSDRDFGIWAGASVQEVGQVVAAASPAGAAALAVAVVVKLTRVLLLAPVVAAVSAGRRFRPDAPSPVGGVRRPPLVPLFVIGFVACAVLRTLGLVPEMMLGPIAQIQIGALGAALFGMGASVRLGSLVRGSGPLMLTSALATLFVLGVSLVGVAV
ncbi:putative sulfate exporter family transporter [Nocardioides sp. WS12]|uniref:YeiH family protein n=1 Tax=Nocardioides sp. WS12 TaxID=2486272 RepID=UPI00191DBEB7|nr:putative sulfate exporter family transporter [Nocardioides sp. WS12]